MGWKLLEAINDIVGSLSELTYTSENSHDITNSRLTLEDEIYGSSQVTTPIQDSTIPMVIRLYARLFWGMKTLRGTKARLSLRWFVQLSIRLTRTDMQLSAQMLRKVKVTKRWI